MTQTRYVVSTECPTCGAPLDFDEGSNAVRCGHCRSNLLVTGRRHVLSYVVTPKLDRAGAASAAKFAQPRDRGPFRAELPRLHFFPYYRLTAHELRWEWHVEKRIEMPAIGTLEDRAAEAMLRALASREIEERPKLRSSARHVEKSFPAADFGDLVPYSLGVRPTVLRLSLFRKESAEEGATMIPPVLAAGDARGLGLRIPDVGRVAHRSVLAPVLSILYFPFWTVEIAAKENRSVTVLDGITSRVAQLAGDPARLRALAAPSSAETEVVGFRALACPNCGWDLPLRANDVVFCCQTCARAWELQGSALEEVPASVVEAPPPGPSANAAGPRYLPFWIVRDLYGGQIFAPAFRYRAIKALGDLALRLSDENPPLEFSSRERPTLEGAYLDRADAIEIARFVAAGRAKGVTPPAKVPGTPPALTWIPYRPESGAAFRDPFVGTALAANLFLD